MIINKIDKWIKTHKKASAMYLPFYVLAILLLASCAKMGQPDGGWFDETPPKVIGASPEDKGVNVTSKKINIYFDEYVKIDNPTEKVVVSPPQIEVPEIKTAGKKIQVSLVDSLKPNTTYTIDFSDAISDNNENNPMGNYTYSFSTGEKIDTMEVSGYVLESENLEPIKGILVGLYSDTADSAFRTKPMLRVSRQPWPLHYQGCGTRLLPHLCPSGYGWQLYVQSEEREDSLLSRHHRAIFQA